MDGVSPDLVDQLCERLTGYMRRYDLLRSERPPAEAVPTLVASLAELSGRVHGLREGLCVLLGFDPGTDAHKEGPADEFAMDWWNRHHDGQEW